MTTRLTPDLMAAFSTLVAPLMAGLRRSFSMSLSANPNCGNCSSIKGEVLDWMAARTGEAMWRMAEQPLTASLRSLVAMSATVTSWSASRCSG
jgi:hypothetical protein